MFGRETRTVMYYAAILPDATADSGRNHSPWIFRRRSQLLLFLGMQTNNRLQDVMSGSSGSTGAEMFPQGKPHRKKTRGHVIVCGGTFSSALQRTSERRSAPGTQPLAKERPAGHQSNYPIHPPSRMRQSLRGRLDMQAAMHCKVRCTACRQSPIT